MRVIFVLAILVEMLIAEVPRIQSSFKFIIKVSYVAFRTSYFTFYIYLVMYMRSLMEIVMPPGSLFDPPDAILSTGSRLEKVEMAPCFPNKLHASNFYFLPVTAFTYS